jgi:hypothetical protein
MKKIKIIYPFQASFNIKECKKMVKIYSKEEVLRRFKNLCSHTLKELKKYI